MDNLRIYKPTLWYDNLVEFPDRFKANQVFDSENNPIPNVFEVEKREGFVYEEGTPVEERIMNNIEKGILNNNTFLLKSMKDIDNIQLQLLILQATITGEVNGDVFVDDFDNIDSITLERGIYHQKERLLYCVDPEGERIELSGYAIAIG